MFKNLKATLDYADNPDKPTAPEYLDEDLYAALRYAENDDKTDRKMFVGGILAHYLEYYGPRVWVNGYAILLHGNCPVDSEYVLSSIEDIDRVIHTPGRTRLNKETISKIAELLQ